VSSGGEPRTAGEPGFGDGAPVVLISGAAGGIGSAIARRYARDGARIALLDLDKEGLVSLADALSRDGASTLRLVCDITDEEACRRAVERVVGAWGRLDVLVNNAGRTHLSFVDETDASVFRRVMEVNFFGAVHLTQAALVPLAERGGSIAVMSSVAGFGPLSGRSGYAASKHALHGFFDSLRGELRAAGVSVTLVCPSFVRTDIGASALGADGGPATRARTEMGTPMEPDEVAEAVYRGVRRRRRLVVVPAMGRLAYLVSRVAPGLYERLMLRKLALSRGTRAASER
jgi:NAD(P)-dependent dehydrogenase (short-subunit alcohol dehydrogenase family)